MLLSNTPVEETYSVAIFLTGQATFVDFEAIQQSWIFSSMYMYTSLA